MNKITCIVLLFCVSFLNAQVEKYTLNEVSINTKYSDFGVSYYGENTAVFASARKDKTVRNRIWTTNNQPFLELFKGTIGDDGDINNVKKFSKILNTKFHESNVAFTKDLKNVYFTRNNYLNKKFKKDSAGWNLNQLYLAKIGNDGKWIDIQAMPFNSDNYQTGHPVLNTAEDKLYFVSDMPGSLGLTDIYVVDIYADGTYGQPKNLGADVNTTKSELFPFIDENDVLYYSSNGFTDLIGGLDIYATKLRMNSSYFKPQNLGYPINSINDDFAIVFQKNERFGYLSSNREGGKGDDDIYFFKELTPIKFDCKQKVKGVVKNYETRDLFPGATVKLYDVEGNIMESVVSDNFGGFTFILDCDSEFKVEASKENYKEDSKVFVTENNIKLELKLEALPDKLEEFVNVRGQLMINIHPIYFDFDKATITSDATKELDKVVEIMNKYPELKIEGGSHTDSRGASKYNKALSTRRAKSTVAYIISKGIDSNRITAKGYGERQLVNNCVYGIKCSEVEHQLNRRTEFVIQNMDEIRKKYPELYIIKATTTKE